MEICGIYIDETHRQIARVLLDTIYRYRETGITLNQLITYGDLWARLGVSQKDLKFGNVINNLVGYLGDLSCICHANKMPFISVIVVNKKTLVAGKGFFELYRREGGELSHATEEEIFKAEVKAVTQTFDNWLKLDYLLGGVKSNFSKSNVEIRLIPMSRQEFNNDTFEDVQREFFQYSLPYEQDYEYWFRKQGIMCGKGALILFQYDNKIIASAVFKEIERFEETDKEGYDGRIIFEEGSINVFEPISKEELSSIDPNFSGFSQSKQFLNPGCYNKITSRINENKYFLDPHDITEPNTEYDQVVKARIGQIGFKKDLLKLDGKCRICGLDFEPLLIASHIKPWRESCSNERVDMYNGLLLCPTHDALFDKGYISFEESGDIIISPQIETSAYDVLNINPDITIKIYEANQKYLSWHRENIFLDYDE